MNRNRIHWFVPTLLALAFLAVLAPPATADEMLLTPDKLTEQAPDTFDVRFECNSGAFVVSITRELAPQGADRFYNLVKHGFFEDARFFRVVPDFVVQFGLNADPKVNEAWANARIRDDRVKDSNKKGTITFATAGPNTRTTQLFINLKDNANLDMQGFSPFGTVTEGMDVVEAITAEYGQRADQGQIRQQGNAYLTAQFPNMGFVKKATISNERKAETREAPKPEAK